QHEDDCETADETHAKPENKGYSECKLRQENDWAEDLEVGEIDITRQLAVNGERGAVRHLLRPVLQTARERERQFPEDALKPHAAHKHTNEPCGKIRRGTLRRVLLPVPYRDENACTEEDQEQGNKQILPWSKGVMVPGIADDEIPKIRSRVRHGGPPGV